MMPGSLIFRSIAGAVNLSAAGTSADPVDATRTFVLLLQALLTVGAMATGLAIGALLAAAVLRVVTKARPSRPSIDRLWSLTTERRT
jgi:uncharacterized membrane protein YjjB (DUF3815 family)